MWALSSLPLDWKRDDEKGTRITTKQLKTHVCHRNLDKVVAASLYSPLFYAILAKRHCWNILKMHVLVSKRHFLSLSRHPKHYFRLANALWIIRQIHCGALITQMSLACNFAPLYVHKCVHSHVQSDVGWQSETQGRETVGDTGRESASAQTSSLLCVGFQFHSGAAASDFLWMVPHAAEISVCSPDPHFSSPPLWLPNTRWSCYNVWMYKVLNIWFLHLLKCRFEKRDVKVVDDTMVGVACLSLSVSLMALVFSSMCFYLHSCYLSWDGGKGNCFYSIFTILFLSPDHPL